MFNYYAPGAAAVKQSFEQVQYLDPQVRTFCALTKLSMNQVIGAF